MDGTSIRIDLALESLQCHSGGLTDDDSKFGEREDKRDGVLVGAHGRWWRGIRCALLMKMGIGVSSHVASLAMRDEKILFSSTESGL